MFRLAQKEHLIVPAHIDHLGNLRDFVTQIGSKYGFSHKLVNAFKLAIDEAATNIIQHAYGDNEGYITIQAIIRRKSLTINLIDQGLYFDPKWAQSPNLKEHIDIGQKAGLGILMIRKLMDKIEYQKTEAGNELSLTKYDKHARKKTGFNDLFNLPHAMKVKYLVHAIVFVTILNIIGFSYYYTKTEDKITAACLNSGSKLSKQTANQLSSVKPSLLNGPDGTSYINAIIFPIYDENIDQIYSLSLEDSLGFIAWSTVASEIALPFKRAERWIQISPGVFDYAIHDTLGVFEFERELSFQEGNSTYKKVHVLLSKDYVDRQIYSKRLHYAKVTLIILGLSYIILAFLTYFMTHPIRKLLEWVKTLAQGEFREEMDIDSSSDIGEIAQAFSDITEKFNETQKHLAHREKFEKEIHLAKDIQESLLPARIPNLDTLEIIAYYEAAQSVSGDYYDFIEVDKDTLGVVVADVSGKGVPGSLIMTMVRTALRTEARGVKDAAEVLARVNDFIMNDMKNGIFVTIFYMIIDTKKHCLNFASAGHTPLILHRSETEKTFYLNPVGFPIGIQLPRRDLFSRSLQSESIQLEANDTLLLYTDGITETMNSKRELYGEERLLKVMRKHSHLSLNSFMEKLRNSIYSFREEEPQNDDITFVAIREKLKSEEQGNLPDEKQFDQNLSVEAKFLSIENITKILDVISHHPDYEASDISQELNTKRYKYTKIDADKINTELLRRGLHTPQLRKEYIKICKERKRSTNPPGTPKLTLSGNVRLRGRPHRKQKETENNTTCNNGKKTNGKDSSIPRDADVQAKFSNLRDPELESPTSNFSPDIEADFVFGDFLDELITSDEQESLTAEDSPKDSIFDEQDIASDKGHEVAESEDISDYLIDSIFDNYFTETNSVTEAFESEQSSTQPDDSMAWTDSANLDTDPTIEEEGEDSDMDATAEIFLSESDIKAEDISTEEISDVEPEKIDQNDPFLDSTTETVLSRDIESSDSEDDKAPIETTSHESDTLMSNLNLEIEEISNLTEDGENYETISEEKSDEIESSEITGESDLESLNLQLKCNDFEDVYAARAFAKKQRLEPPPQTASDEESSLNDQSPEGLHDEIKETFQEKANESVNHTPPVIASIEEIISSSQPDILAPENAHPEMSPPDDVTAELDIERDESLFDSTIAALLSHDEPKIDFDGSTEEQAGCEQISKEREEFDIVIENEALNDLSGDVEDRRLSVDNFLEEQTSEDTVEPVLGSREDLQITSNEFEDLYTGTVFGKKQDNKLLNKTPAEAESSFVEQNLNDPGPEGGEDSQERPFEPVDTSPTLEEVTSETNLIDSTDKPVDQLNDILMSGIRYYKNRQYEDAIICFKKVIKINPDFGDAYQMLGNAFFRNDMLNEALTSYEHLKKIHQVDSSIRENLGLIYSKLDEHELAIREWKEVLKAQPGRLDIEKKMNRTLSILNEDSKVIPDENSMHKQIEMKNPSLESIDGESQAAEVEPEYGRQEKSQLLQAGIDLYRKQDYEAAIQTFKSAIEQFPDKKDAYNYLANAYFRNRMFKEAAEIYERLKKMDVENSTTLENLGFIHVKQGSYAQAVNEWSKILQINPDRVDIKRKIEKVSQLI